MRKVEWNRLKNQRLKETRGASFEDLLSAEFIGLHKHPKRKTSVFVVI